MEQWPEDETDLTREQLQKIWERATPVEVVTQATLHSSRAYLLIEGENGELRAGPLDPTVMEDDVILCYNSRLNEQWACKVLSISLKHSVGQVKRL